MVLILVSASESEAKETFFGKKVPFLREANIGSSKVEPTSQLLPIAFYGAYFKQRSVLHYTRLSTV